MAEVIRLVCPECDAVHRVKSVTLGKLYRCKKCRSGLITMQPAILSCPNCGATTPPTHIEASRLITCEECEKAPLMEVRLPGVEYPKPIISVESEDVAAKMFVSNEVDGSEDEETEDNGYQDNLGEVVVSESGDSNIDEPEEIDENVIFKADTNFIVKGKEREEAKNDKSSLKQREIFEQPEGVTEDVNPSSDVISEHEELVSDNGFEEQYFEETLPNIEVVKRDESEEVHSEEIEEDANGAPVVYQRMSVEGQDAVAKEERIERKNGWNWSLPAWVPAILALLLVGLYGMLYADLDSMKIQLEKAQTSVIKQDSVFQEERNKYIALVRSTLEEKKKLEGEIRDLQNENEMLRRKSVTFEAPELKDDL